MYTFVSVWLVSIAFIVFLGGLIYRFVKLITRAKKDKVIFPYMSLKYSLRSLIHWIIPFASRNMRMRYEMTVVTFAFHLCLVLAPIFLTAHVAMIAFSWGVSWPMLSEAAADGLTMVVILAAVFFLVRRWMLPEVRFVTYPSDYILLLVAAAPFITGFVAHRQWVNYDVIVIIHMICGAAMLILVPLTRLSHMLFFPFTRAYMGCEFGAVRNAKDW